LSKKKKEMKRKEKKRWRIENVKTLSLVSVSHTNCTHLLSLYLTHNTHTPGLVEDD